MALFTSGDRVVVNHWLDALEPSDLRAGTLSPDMLTALANRRAGAEGTAASRARYASEEYVFVSHGDGVAALYRASELTLIE